MINEGNHIMSSTPDSPLRRRIALAVGAGALVLVGGAGVAYAATSIADPVETGWAAVVDDREVTGTASGDDPTTRSDRSAQARDGRDCPEQGAGGSEGGSEGGGQGDSESASPSQSPDSAAPSQDGDL